MPVSLEVSEFQYRTIIKALTFYVGNKNGLAQGSIEDLIGLLKGQKEEQN